MAMGMSIFSMSVMSIIALGGMEEDGELHLLVQISSDCMGGSG
jgi:hypothetical protein